MPQSQNSGLRLLPFKPLSVRREPSYTEGSDTGNSDDASKSAFLVEGGADDDELSSSEQTGAVRHENHKNLIETYLNSKSRERVVPKPNLRGGKNGNGDKRTLVNRPGGMTGTIPRGCDEDDDDARILGKNAYSVPVDDFNRRLAEQQPGIRDLPPESPRPEPESDNNASGQGWGHRPAPTNGRSSIVQNAFDRMRPKRKSPEIATITIGSKTTTTVLGSSLSKRQKLSATPNGGPKSRLTRRDSSTEQFGSNMRAFAAPGTQVTERAGEYPNIAGDEEEDIESADEKLDNGSSTATEGSRFHTAEEGSQELENADEKIEAGEDELIGSLKLTHSGKDSDDEFLDEKDKRAKENAKVAQLIQQAEEKLAMPTSDDIQRAHKKLAGSGQKDSTTQLLQVIRRSVDRIEKQMQRLEFSLRKGPQPTNRPLLDPTSSDISPEERLSLTVSKNDFSRMHIVGQFNLGFILATRPANHQGSADELFIIDQHASDEKYNFERLQSSTVVQNQRLVQPRTLDLTAIEEEIILENNPTLLKNGFLVSIDQSGDLPVGRRCKLLSLPMSHEVTFDVDDLEELIALLADFPALPAANSGTTEETIFPTKNLNSYPSITRPSKVRRMFAMRACRSSIMVGKPLSTAQMERLVQHMGEIDKPWNCPHGRPTMRHLLGLGTWQGWDEEAGTVDWREFLSEVGYGGIPEESEVAGEDEDEGGNIE